MIIISIFYYIAISSATLFYGIGIGRSCASKINSSMAILSFVKSLSICSSTTALSYLCIRWLLPRANLFELYPFIVAFVFLTMTILIELFLDVGIKKSPAEFSVTFLSSLLALNESLSIAHAVVISCACICSFYSFLFIFHAIRDRASLYSDPQGITIYPTLFLSLAVIVLALCGISVSWICAFWLEKI